MKIAKRSLLLAATLATAVGTAKVTEAACPATQTFHLQVQSTYVAGYKDMTSATGFEAAVQQSSTASITAAGEYQLGAVPLKWISPAYTKNTDLAGGPWTFDVYGLTTNSGAVGQLYAKVYSYNGGVPSLLFTTGYANPNISTAVAQTRFTWNYTPLAGTTVPTGDRIYVEIWVHATAGSSGVSTVVDLVNADVATANDAGTVTGTYLDTQVCDTTNESIRETNVALPRLDHVWSIPLTTGTAHTFNAVAWVNSATQVIALQWGTSSTGPWTAMFDVWPSSTPGCATPLTFTLPSAQTGTIYIHAVTVNPDGTRHRLYVDYMAVETTISTPPYFTLNYDFATADSLVTASDCAACTVPGVPTALTLTTPADDAVHLAWTAGAPAGATYNVYRATGACPQTTALLQSGIAATTYDDLTAVGGTLYSYQVSAVDVTGFCESAKSTCANISARGTYSNGRFVSGRPQDTTTAGLPVRWIFDTPATALTPPGVGGAVYAVSNDRMLHSAINAQGAGAGQWPATWKPLAMNAPSQARPPIITTSIIAGHTKLIFLSSQDGRVYCADASTGALIWTSAVLGDYVQGAANGYFTAFGGTWDLIFVGTRNTSTGNTFYMLNAATGATITSFDNGGGANSIGIISGGAQIDYTNKRVYFTSRQYAGGSTNTVWCRTFTNVALSACAGWPASGGVAIGNTDSAASLLGNKLYVGNNASQVYALNATTGAPLWGAPYDCANGAVKGAVIPDYGSTTLYLSTNTKVWSLNDGGANATLNWSATTIANPSMPLFMRGLNAALVGSSDGKLHQINTGTGVETTPVTLGTGAFTVGSPTLDVPNSMAYVGTTSGDIYSATVPLP